MSDQNSGGSGPEAGPEAGPGTGAGSLAPARWRWVLPLSLTANLLVVGLIGGAALRHAFEEGGGGPMAVRDLAFGPFTAALTRDDRDALRRSFTTRAGELRDLRPAGRAEFDRLLAALRAVPFDLAVVKAEMSRQRERMAERLGLGQDLLVERIAAMSDGERAEFADRVAGALRHGAGEGAGDGPGGGRD